MKDNEIDSVMSILSDEIAKWETPAVTIVSQRSKDPYKVLISCLLSLRTKDNVTAIASERLFSLASNPVDMLKLDVEIIEKAVYPVGFYHNKAKQILDISQILLKNYDGRVPESIEELLKLPGVGRKTANLTVVLGYGKPGICVDTHVHRICNRLGYVTTKTPFETEMELRGKLPLKYWSDINDFLVTFGQNLCKPVSPICSKCAVSAYCDRNGVEISR